MQSREATFTRGIVLFSLLPGIALAGMLSLRAYRAGQHGDGFGWAATAGSLLLLAGAVWCAVGFLARRRKQTGIFLVIAILNLFMVVPELALRVVGFQHESGVQFGYPRPTDCKKFVVDKDLFWKFSPADEDINAAGFMEREFRPKQPGVFRAVFLGDSCTNQGYPAIAEEILNGQATAGRRYECLNLAIAGYSSYQGSIVAEKYAQHLAPDIVFVYFGWNDHWLAFGKPDAEKVLSEDYFPSPLVRLIRQVRLVQVLQRYCSFRTTKPLSVPRVSKQEYRRNLDRIVDMFAGRGIPVVMLTAPTTFYQWNVPGFLLKRQQIQSREQALEFHSAYNDIVRTVAQERGQHLIDLAGELNGGDSLETIFKADGIHFTPDGLKLVAERVSSVVRACSHEAQ